MKKKYKTWVILFILIIIKQQLFYLIFKIEKWF